MQEEITTRMGDGRMVKMSAAQVREDIATGTWDAADRGHIPELTGDEQEQLYEIIADKNRVVSVSHGEEVVLTDDVSYIRMNQDEGASGGLGIPLSPPLSMLVHERAFAQDSAVMGATGLTGKAEFNWKIVEIEQTNLLLTIPMLYVSGPNMLTFYKPVGRFDNPSDLLPLGKIDQAREVQEEAAAASIEDLVWLGKHLADAGIDCLNLDTVAAHGDTDFYVALKAVQKLKELAPQMAIEMGMASEFVMGMHGKITFNGKRLAGMYPHEQLKVAEEAGVDIFGPVVNVNRSRSFPWNISRVATFVKYTSSVSNIPIHPNVGVAVCGVPMCSVPPIDCVSRVAKTLAQIGKADGL